MTHLIQEVTTEHSPESLVGPLAGEPGTMLFRSALRDSPQGRYSFVVTRPFLTFRSFDARCEITSLDRSCVHFGNPWLILDRLMSRYELLDEIDLPFPLGGCFGYWGYDLKHFVEPKLDRRSVNDLELPDCYVGFYDSLVAFDHYLAKAWIISTGLTVDGSRSNARARAGFEFWKGYLKASPEGHEGSSAGSRPDASRGRKDRVSSSFTRQGYLEAVHTAKDLIHRGHIYQVNLAQRLSVSGIHDGWAFYHRLASVSPAPFAAYIHAGPLEIISSSPELFLRLSGSHITTRPIKGTRPRASDITRDAQLTYQLQTSQKELAELVMITDLLRNDLGRVCEFGSVQVPEILRLEHYSHVQHLVSTVEGRLAEGVTHFEAFSQCFPGGSITGVPKFRAMQVIESLEPVTRGPYTGSLGYLGFNRESRLSIVIRAAFKTASQLCFNVGSGIVADSDPEAEHEETLAKAGGFLAALELPQDVRIRSP